MTSNADGTGHRVRSIAAQRYTLRPEPNHPERESGGRDMGRHSADEGPVPLLTPTKPGKRKPTHRKK
jgi:hypothetical protein